MALQFLGKDPESEYNGSPTVWDDGDCYVIQGWRITDPGTLAQIGNGARARDGAPAPQADDAVLQGGRQ